mgnify:CR=1 FL=1
MRDEEYYGVTIYNGIRVKRDVYTGEIRLKGIWVMPNTPKADQLAEEVIKESKKLADSGLDYL